MCPNIEMQICVRLSFNLTESSIALIMNGSDVRSRVFGTLREACRFSSGGMKHVVTKRW